MVLLVDSGLVSAFVGIEAGNNEDLELYHKNNTVEDNHKIIELFWNCNIPVDIGFICFNPYSTINSLRKNIEYLEKYGFASFDNIETICQLTKGTKMYDKAEADGLLKGFKHKEVFDVYDFLKAYISFISQGSLKDDYAECLSYRQHLQSNASYFLRSRCDEQYKIALKYLQRANAILYTTSVYIANWFKELLDIAEKGWNVEEAMQKSDKIINSDLLTTTIDILNADKEACKKELDNLGNRLLIA